MLFFLQLRSSTDSNRRAVETLESKLSKMKAEWESSKLAHEATRAEFESYKVGTWHSWLKSYKSCLICGRLNKNNSNLNGWSEQWKYYKQSMKSASENELTA